LREPFLNFLEIESPEQAYEMRILKSPGWEICTIIELNWQRSNFLLFWIYSPLTPGFKDCRFARNHTGFFLSQFIRGAKSGLFMHHCLEGERIKMRSFYLEELL